MEEKRKSPKFKLPFKLPKLPKLSKLSELFKRFKIPKLPLDRKKLKEKLPKKISKTAIRAVIIFFGIIFLLVVVSRIRREGPAPQPVIKEKLEEKPTAITTLTDTEIRAQLETRTSRIEETLGKYNERVAQMEEKVDKVAEVGQSVKDYQAGLDESITSAIQKILPEIESKFRDIVASAPGVTYPPTWEEARKPLYQKVQPEAIPSEVVEGAPTPETIGQATPPVVSVTPTIPRVARKIQILSKEEEEEEITPLITEGITPKTPYVYLPLGSFAKGTLLTGAYAPTDETNPLPILISIDEAFYGPSRSRIPLKGCLAIGKAVGDINSARAIIQIMNISYVMPDGRVFETEGDLGYVVDTEGILGVPGKIVRKSGRVLTGAFATGFLSGAATGLAAGETTTFITPETGVATQIITGDFLKAAGYKGLAQAAERMSDYYARELEKITTAIRIDTGQKINLVMQKGVIIEGFQPKTYMFGARPPSVFD